MRAPSPATGRLARDDGSSLTEFAIVAPLFVLLLYWSNFFTEVGVAKLKVEEAARFGAWEMVAQRPRADVEAELVQKFADLDSARNPTRGGTFSFRGAAVTAIVRDDVPALLGGNIPRPTQGGLIGRIIGAVANFFGRAVNWAMYDRFKFNQNGAAEAEVRFTVRNTMFPGGNLLGIFFDSGRSPQMTMRARSPAIVWDTWKAWPGKYGPESRNTSTDVYDTYPRGNSASAPEKVVAAQVRKIAYLGFSTNIVARVINYISYVGFPEPIPNTTWDQKHGPVVMLQAEAPRQSWAPGSQHKQRLGDKWFDTSSGMRTNTSPVPGVDRSRYTIPYKINTKWWTKSGGMDGNFSGPALATVAQATTNPYVKAMACRDVWYMGSRRAQNGQFRDRARYLGEAYYPGCR